MGMGRPTIESPHACRQVAGGGGSLVAMSPGMHGLSQIRKIAKDCRDRAARTEVAAERDLLCELARHWEAVADIREELQRLHNTRL